MGELDSAASMPTFRGMRHGALRLLAPAKINLHLRVGPRRSDGFHPLLSWMATIGLFDTLSFTAGLLTDSVMQDRSDGVVMTCDDPSLPCDDRNLVVKAAAQFHQRHRSASIAGKVAA